MTISMYAASVPAYQAALNGTLHCLKKAQENARERDIAEEVFLNARHVPDMYPLVRQVQIASDMAKGGTARLAGVEVPSWEDNETTFGDLHDRIGKTQEFIAGFEAGDIDGSEDREITLNLGGDETTFTGQIFLLHFNLPNFYFHTTTAYSILRAQGVPIGKRDYFGRP